MEETINITDTWEGCLSLIRENITPKSVKTWFEVIKPVKITGNTLLLQVPSSYVYEYIEEHYIDLFKKAIRSQFGAKTQIEYSISRSNSVANSSPPNNKRGIKISKEYIQQRAKHLGMGYWEDTTKKDKWIEGFKITPDNEEVITILCEYFNKDANFIKRNPQNSFSKGLLLQGGYGCGKTSLMKILQVNSQRNFQIVKCTDIADTFKMKGREGIFKYYKATDFDNPRNYIGKCVCFDDIGRELENEQLPHFWGDYLNVIGHIFFNRYDNNYPGYFNFGTTNLTGTDIERIYGPGVKSRMKAMFNLIAFPKSAKDFRENI